ncbi:MAG: STAS domain-containing protein [Bacteriovoracaceae bacterium]|nr:STAS domain-containing protein [Bacteriovoracaceae bacterium]
MKAVVHTNSNGDITVHMQGGLDYNTGVPFREELEMLTKENPTSTITLDMDSLDFVGSSGIGLFVETIISLNKLKAQIRLANVKTEFLRVFKLYDFDALSSLIQQFDDDDTEKLNIKFGNRRKTFQN